MSEPKTRKTTSSVEKFLASVAREKRREDCRAVVQMMRSITGEEPAMWGGQPHRLRVLPLRLRERPGG